MVQLNDLKLTSEQLAVLQTCPSRPVPSSRRSTSNAAFSGQQSFQAEMASWAEIQKRYSAPRRNPYASGRPTNQQSANNNDDRGQLIRVTAAAGAGKTTTLLALALHAAEKWQQHQQNEQVKIGYLTFTNAAAKDGARRLNEAFAAKLKASEGQKSNLLQPIDLDARTLHSCAYRLLQDHKKAAQQQQHAEQDATDPSTLWSDDKVKKWIGKECEQQVQNFLQSCFAKLIREGGSSSSGNNQNRSKHRSSIRFLEDSKRRAKEQVLFFIFKSLMHFCQSPWTLEEYMPRTPHGRPPFGRDYYPMVLFHGSNGRGISYGFDPRVYDKTKITFYAEQVVRLWTTFIAPSNSTIRTFDFDMKQAQLLKLRIPGHLLLVDEAQDMDGCQMKWIGEQSELHRTHVYVVGDPAQTIYGFRGAKSKHLMDLNSSRDCMLTESWRFGRRISQIANLILFAKEYSDQTAYDYRGRPKNWKPYRTRAGNEQKEAFIVTESMVEQWRTLEGGVTLIARANATLLMESLKAIGFDISEGENDNGPHVTKPNSSPVAANNSVDCPKIHINGRGESSGLSLWKKTVKMIQAMYGLYKYSKNGPGSDSGSDPGSTGMPLDPSMFPDFVGRNMTWSTFASECVDKELGRYLNGIQVVSKLRDRTIEAMDTFRATVMEKNYSAEEADIILTTCHSAKGMEWENVQVCDDFVDINQYEAKPGEQQGPSARMPSSIAGKRPRQPSVTWKFSFCAWGDDVNLVYVACTRAMRKLSIPPGIARVLESFDKLHEWRQQQQQFRSSQRLQVDGCKMPLEPDEAIELYKQLAQKFREECRLLGDDQLLCNAVLGSVEPSTCTSTEEQPDSVKTAAKDHANSIQRTIQKDIRSYFGPAPVAAASSSSVRVVSRDPPEDFNMTAPDNPPVSTAMPLTPAKRSSAYERETGDGAMKSDGDQQLHDMVTPRKLFKRSDDDAS